MSGRSSAKRPLEVDEEERSQHEIHRLNLKKYQHDVNSSSISASQSTSRSSGCSVSSLKTLGDEVQELSVRFEEGVAGGSARDDLQSSSTCQFLQLPSSSLTISSVSQKSFTRKEEKVCFGMLKEVEIKIVPNQNKDPTTFENIGSNEGGFVDLDLIFGQDRCDVQFQGTIIASLQTRTQHALQQLRSCSKERVQYKALVSRAELVDKLDAIMQPLGIDKSKLPWAMNIQVFGVRSIAETVAKELSKYRLFLQHPFPMSFHAVYENPQYFSIVGSSFTNGAVLPPISVGVTQSESDSNDLPEELRPVLEEIGTVMNNLPRHDYLGEADVDDRINTDLLSHQKIAVNFVMRQESTEERGPGMLWKVDYDTLGGPVFRHKITGSRSQTPETILGGILADDMGLGKTLTMIAAIVMTLSRAKIFATEELQGSESDKIPVMSTLVIVPSVLLLNGWIDEIIKHVVPKTLKTYTYHGPDRNLASSPPSPLPYHIVFSTYGTVAVDFISGGGVLNWFHWYRLILDEAHTVRNWSTKSFKAVASLSANIRWCMTGTPVQNSLHDLRSLVQFLRVPRLKETAVFQRHIAERGRIGRGGPRSLPDYENLKLLLGSICLRRSISSLSLGVTYLFERPHLSEVERIAYNNLAMSCKRSVDAALSELRATHGNRAILTALLRLRIFCNTGLSSLVAMGKDAIEQFNPDEINSLLQQSGEISACVACGCNILSFDTNDDLRQQLLNPHSRFKCKECAQLYAAFHGDGRSSQRRHSSAQNVDMQPILDSKEESGYESVSKDNSSISDLPKYPSKLKAVLSDIVDHHSKEKCIVFSFWIRSLDLMARILHGNNIVFGQVDGTLSPDQRQKVLARFHSDRSVKVLLMTLGTGAQGINNLSVASRIHILEPQWNPSVEDQAVGRVLRLGQDKKVCVIRYIMSKTIEESVRDRQMVKIQLALAGGLQSSDTNKSSKNQRMICLQELSKIIELTISTENLTAFQQAAENKL